MQQLKL